MRNTALVVLGFFLGWLALDRLAYHLGSFRGEWGLPVALATVGVLLLFELVVFRRKPLEALRLLGFVLPEARLSIAVLVLCLALIAFLPIYASLTATPLVLAGNWPVLALGILCQGGIAEETLFRGYLFRHFREGRTFWGAAILSAIPFVAVHILLFDGSDWMIALAAIVVSLSVGFPLAWAFERGGNSVLPVALLHAVIQGAIKLVASPGMEFLRMALVWMAVSSLLPWLLFLIKSKNQPVTTYNQNQANQ